MVVFSGSCSVVEVVVKLYRIIWFTIIETLWLKFGSDGAETTLESVISSTDVTGNNGAFVVDRDGTMIVTEVSFKIGTVEEDETEDIVEVEAVVDTDVDIDVSVVEVRLPTVLENGSEEVGCWDICVVVPIVIAEDGKLLEVWTGYTEVVIWGITVVNGASSVDIVLVSVMLACGVTITFVSLAGIWSVVGEWVVEIKGTCDVGKEVVVVGWFEEPLS